MSIQIAVDDWQQKVVNLKSQGFNNCEIARELWGSSYYEYKVRAALKTNVTAVIQEYTDPFNLNPNDVNILYLDIETSPCISYHFQHWNVNISQQHNIQQSHLLSVAYAFNDDDVVGFKLSAKDVENQDDLTLVVNLIEAIEKADIIVGYNSKKFDLKYLNTRALFYNLPPLSTVKHIDLYEQVKRSFKFPSNSMGNVSKYLGLEGKLANDGFDLWKRCMEHWNEETCEKALDDMLTYNMQDIEATRDLYKYLQGWFKGTPNVGMMKNQKSSCTTLRCSKCSSDDIIALEKQHFLSNVWEMYRCNTCNGVSRFSKKGLVGI